MAKPAFPDGVDQSALDPRNPRRVIALRFLLFASILVVAILGFLGGHKARIHTADSAVARLTIETPDRLRNGNFFETRVRIDAKRPIADAVIAWPAALVRESTLNSLVPEPDKEEFVDGEYRFHLGTIETGKSLSLKIDGQLNPPLFGTLSGDVRLLDDKTEITRFPLEIKVLP